MLEFQELIKDFVEKKSIKTRLTDNRLGYDWVQFFLKRHKLSFKKGQQMQLARKNVTSNPFTVYGYYEILEKEVERLGLKDKQECVYNCDKSGFPIDPTKCKYIGTVGRNHLSNYFHSLLSFLMVSQLCFGSIKAHGFTLSLFFLSKCKMTANSKPKG